MNKWEKRNKQAIEVLKIFKDVPVIPTEGKEYGRLLAGECYPLTEDIMYFFDKEGNISSFRILTPNREWMSYGFDKDGNEFFPKGEEQKHLYNLTKESYKLMNKRDHMFYSGKKDWKQLEIWDDKISKINKEIRITKEYRGYWKW